MSAALGGGRENLNHSRSGCDTDRNWQTESGGRPPLYEATATSSWLGGRVDRRDDHARGLRHRNGGHRGRRVAGQRRQPERGGRPVLNRRGPGPGPPSNQTRTPDHQQALSPASTAGRPRMRYPRRLPRGAPRPEGSHVDRLAGARFRPRLAGAPRRDGQHGGGLRPRLEGGAGSVVNRCGGDWSAMADAPSAPQARRSCASDSTPGAGAGGTMPSASSGIGQSSSTSLSARPSARLCSSTKT